MNWKSIFKVALEVVLGMLSKTVEEKKEVR